nr:uncharacterized protein LOC111425338 isoform X1 [Onthophagus taurus]
MEFRVGDNIVGCVELNGYAGEGIADKLYKYYNEALNSDSTTYEDKCKIIIEIWKAVGLTYKQHNLQDIIRVMEWGKHHTFDIVLDGQWDTHKTYYEQVFILFLKECEENLVKVNKQFHYHFQRLIKLIQQPWDNKVLRAIIQSNEKSELTEKEIDYFTNESGYTISMRIKKLIDAQCEDLAMNLCSSYLKCLKLAEEGKVTLAVTEDHKRYAFDVYIALLYSSTRMDKIISLLKDLNDKEAKELVGRFASKDSVNCKVWRSSYKLTFISAMLFLKRHAQLESFEDQQTVLHIMKGWLKSIENGYSVSDAVIGLKRLLTQETTSIFIYTLIESLNSIDVKQTRIELYIRALNKDLNRLETSKVVKEDKLATSISQALAEGLLKLAAELDDHLTVARECVLTAFSLNPTRTIFDLIEKMANRCGLNVLDTGQWKCKFHAMTETGDTTNICEACNEPMEPISLRAFNTNTILSEALTVENVGLPQELCDDLVIILCSPRYQLLSWLQEWSDLHRFCIMYLDNPHKTKNYITELKFIEIDYSLFQKARQQLQIEPVDICFGYDKVLEESDAEDEASVAAIMSDSSDEIIDYHARRKNKMKKQVIRDTSDEEEEEPSNIQEPNNLTSELIEKSYYPQSDPEVLKSLRSFRKRKTEEELREIPSKITLVETSMSSCSSPFAQILDWTSPLKQSLDNIHNQLNEPQDLPQHQESRVPPQPQQFQDLQQPYQKALQLQKLLDPQKPLGVQKDLDLQQPLDLQKPETRMQESPKPQQYQEPKQPQKPEQSQEPQSLHTSSLSTEEPLNPLFSNYIADEAMDLSKSKNQTIGVIEDFDPFQEIDRILENPGNTEPVADVIIEEEIEKFLDVSIETKEKSESSLVNVIENVELNDKELKEKQEKEEQLNEVLTSEQLDDKKLNGDQSDGESLISEQLDDKKLNGELLNNESINISQLGGAYPPISIENIIRKDIIVRALASKVVLQRLNHNQMSVATVHSPTKLRADINNEDDVLVPCCSPSSTIEFSSNVSSNCNETDIDEKMENPKKLILEDVTQINDNIDISIIEEVVGQKVIKKSQQMSGRRKNDPYLDLVLNQPRYRRSHKHPAKFEDYLYDYPDCRRKKHSKQVDTNKNEVAQDSNDVEDDKRNETSPNVLKSDNYSGQKYSHQDPDVKEQTNQDKSLFREKGTEGIFTEETGKIVKKPHREFNENKENSVYISKRTIKGKIKKKPKKTRRLSKSDEKEIESDREIDGIQVGNEIYSRLLKDVKVVIDRIYLPDGKKKFSLSTDSKVFKMCERLNRKLPRKPFAETNKNQRVLEDWRCKNPEFSNALLEPRVFLERMNVNGRFHSPNNRKNGEKKSHRKYNTGNVRSNNAKNVLANVPGMKDTGLIQPPPVANVVQVVQMTGRSTNASTGSQTSTQVSPHIQRIGQPRQDKPETSEDAAAATTSKASSNSKPATTQPSSLINILSHPVIRTSAGTAASGRTPPVINILSNQIIRPASATRVTRSASTATATMPCQSNNNTIRSSGESQLINQLTNPSRSTTTSSSTIKVATSSCGEPGRIVQFICQSSDGKLIPVSSFAQNCVVKVASSQSVSPTSPGYEDGGFPKAGKNKSSSDGGGVDSECSDTLPKFQQAFGKSVYQTKPTGTNSTNVTNNVVNHEVEKQPKLPASTTTTAVAKPATIPGGVIYTRQVQSGQTINLIPQSRGQVFRIAATSNSDQISVVKDTLIQNKMNALLAAALSKKDSDDSESDKRDDSTPASTATTTTTRVAIATRPGFVQNARIVKPVLQIPSNVIRNAPQNMSSTTLEQLREFDMVYKQVKERSSTTPVSETSTNSEVSESQCISVTYLNQGQKINCAPIVVVSSYNAIQPVSSSTLNVVSQGNTSPRVTPSPSQTASSVIPKVTPKPSKGKTVKTPAIQTASKASPVPKPQQKPQEDEHTTQRIFDILAEYAEQLRNSPDLNNKPAPRRRSNPPTNPSQNSKRKKSSSSKKPSQSNSTLPAEPDTEDPRTLGSEDSSCGVMQLSVPDDEQPVALASTSESNDSTSTPRQQLILTDSSNQPRNLIIAESSVGEALKMPNTAVLVPGNYIMPVSMVKGGQQIAVVSGGSKILATVPARSGPNMLLFQSFLNQNRKSSVSTVKYSAIQPISGISSQSLAGVTAQPPVILPPLSHSISTVTLGQPITVKKLDNAGQVNTELLLTISQSRENDSPEDAPQPDSSTNVVSTNLETVELDEAATLSDNCSEKSYTPYQKPLIASPIATPVIAQTSVANAVMASNSTVSAPPPTEDNISERSSSAAQTVMTLNVSPIEQKGELRKNEERIQTVLVTASGSNGSMIAQARPNFKDSTRTVNKTQSNKDDFLRNNDKRNSDSKNTQSNNAYPAQGKVKKVQVATQRLDRELQQLCLQRKQAALERELRLQKSLSEECEDLGVDEPSTSDLFPEAELLFDSNHSPSFEQTSDVTKRIVVQQEGGKEEAKLTLFSDDDFLFEAGEYQKGEGTAEYDGRTNGQSNDAASPCEDATLLRTCTSMSDVTLNSPISPDTFRPTTPPPLHKYVHKYSNRKKSDKTTKQTDNWTGEVSSSEDTTGSNEIKGGSPEVCSSKGMTIDEDGHHFTDGNSHSFKVVRVAVAKQECGDCSEDGDCSLSGRGARRSVKKLCSCCNGASSQDSRKRPAQPHQHVPVPQKKVFPMKKR